MDKVVFTTMNFPPPRDFVEEWPEDVEPRCMICSAPYCTCMNILFEEIPEGVNQDG